MDFWAVEPPAVNVATVALANKSARIAWALMSGGTDYDHRRCVPHDGDGIGVTSCAGDRGVDCDRGTTEPDGYISYLRTFNDWVPFCGYHQGRSRPDR
jgi:hypothetical protein